MKVFELKIKAYLEAEDIKKVMDGLQLNTRDMDVIEVKISQIADTDQMDTDQITGVTGTALADTDDEYLSMRVNVKKTKPEDLN